MLDIHDFTGGDYLKGADFYGQERTVQLLGFQPELVSDKRRIVARFAGLSKGMVIKAEDNTKALLLMFGTRDVEQWNRIVQSTPTFVTLFAEMTDWGPGMRLRPYQAAPQHAPDGYPSPPPSSIHPRHMEPYMYVQGVPPQQGPVGTGPTPTPVPQYQPHAQGVPPQGQMPVVAPSAQQRIGGHQQHLPPGTYPTPFPQEQPQPAAAPTPPGQPEAVAGMDPETAERMRRQMEES